MNPDINTVKKGDVLYFTMSPPRETVECRVETVYRKRNRIKVKFFRTDSRMTLPQEVKRTWNICYFRTTREETT